MAWNEPGGNNQDPWGSGGRGKKEGPPDLDEVLRKGLDKLNGLFGGKRSSSGRNGGGNSAGDSGSGNNTGLIVLLLVGALLLAGYNSFYRVDEKERAVVLRLGKYLTTEQPGLKFKIPLVDRIFIQDVTSVRNEKKKGHMLTQDENIVDIDLTIQFVVRDLRDYLLKMRDPLKTLDFAIDSALRHEVGGTEMDQVLTEGREVLAIQVEDRLQRYLDFYQSGIQLRSVNINAAQPPEQVKRAFEDVQSAKEDEQKFVNEAETYRNRVVPESRGRAQRIIEEANAYKSEVISRAEGETARFNSILTIYRQAPEVTRERMYLDTMQEVFTNSSKVLIDQEQNGNILMLPLERMLSGGSNVLDALKAGQVQQAAPDPEAANRNASSRRRDNPLRNRR